MTTSRPFLAVMLFATLAASPAAAQYSKSPRTVTFAPALGIDTTKIQYVPGGLGYYDLAAGEGSPAAPGSTVTVHYTGWLTNGTKFDSSRDRSTPFEFVLGAGQVIAGWDRGVTGMKKGQRRMLIIPPALGYGFAGSGDIPPGATLVFDVELLDIK